MGKKLFGWRPTKKYDYEFFDSRINKKNFSKAANTPAEIEKKIKDFYKLNKSYIDKRSNPVIKAYEDNVLSYEGQEKHTPYSLFRSKVAYSLDEGYDVQSAIKMAMNTTTYAGGDVISSRNVYKTLTEDKATFRNFQNLVGKEEINASNFIPKTITYKQDGLEREKKSGDTWLYTTRRGIVIEVSMKYVAGSQKALFSFKRI